MILVAIQEIANTKKHFLAADLTRQTGGIKAYDFMKSKLNPVSNDEVSESAAALNKLNNLKLTSLKSGSCEKFLSVFDRIILDLKEAAPEEAPTYSEEYQKKLIISKLAHETYALMKLNWVTRLPHSEYIQELQAFALTMEKKDPNLRAENNKKSINNTNSSTKTTMEAVDTIEGFPINEYGFVSRKTGLELSNEKKEKINKKRLQIKKDSKKKFAKNPKYQGSSCKSTNSKATKDKDKDKDKSEKKKEQEKAIKSIKSLSMNDDATKKVIQYLEKKCNAVKCSKHRTVSFNTEALQKW